MADRHGEASTSDLVGAALTGDDDALGRLLAAEQAWAYNVAYRVLGRQADAKDAVQEAFLLTIRAFRGDGSPPRTEESFRPWLRRVVVNAALGQIRRRPALHAVTVDDLADVLPGPDHIEPGHSTDAEETRGQVIQTLLGLPETQRVALALREYLDASYDEIGSVLDLPRTAVGTLLFRARAGFRLGFDRIAEFSTPIECPDLVPLFSAIVDDEPRPDSWRVLEAHLRDCNHCRVELRGQRRARRLYALIPLLVLPAGWEPVKSALAASVAGVATATPAGEGIEHVADLGSTLHNTLQATASSAPLTSASGSITAPTLTGTPAAVAPVASSTAATPMATTAGVAAGKSGGFLTGLAAVKLGAGALVGAAALGAVALTGSLDGVPESGAGVASPSPVVAASPAVSPSVAAPIVGSPGAPGASPGIAIATLQPAQPAGAINGPSSAVTAVLPTPASTVPPGSPSTPTLTGSTPVGAPALAAPVSSPRPPGTTSP